MAARRTHLGLKLRPLGQGSDPRSDRKKRPRAGHEKAGGYAQNTNHRVEVEVERVARQRTEDLQKQSVNAKSGLMVDKDRSWDGSSRAESL